jgi:hypothetical protein
MDGQYCILPGKQIYYKSKSNHLHFVDINWQEKSSEDPACSNLKDLQTRKILDNQSTFCNQIEFDAINNQLATFTSPSVLSIFPNLSENEREFEGTFEYQKRYIAGNLDRSFMQAMQAQINREGNDKVEKFGFKKSQEKVMYGKYLCPSDYVSKYCALDAERNTVRVWNSGTGRLIKEFVEPRESYRGFQHHNQWQQHTLIMKDRKTILQQAMEDQEDKFSSSRLQAGESSSYHRSTVRKSRVESSRPTLMSKKIQKSMAQLENMQQRDIWRKIRVEENGVIVEREFFHNYKPGSRVFLSSTNDILLEFHQETIQIYNIRDNNYSERVDEAKKPSHLGVPVYFTQDFKRYMAFSREEGKKKSKKQDLEGDKKLQVRIYETRERHDVLTKSRQFEKFSEIDGLHVPELEDVQKNEHGDPYINFVSAGVITYLNVNDVQQTLRLCAKKELLEEKDQIAEKYYTKESLSFRQQFDSLNFSARQINSLTQHEKSEHAARAVCNFNIEIKKIFDLKDQDDLQLKEAILAAKKQMIIGGVSSNSDMLGCYPLNNLRFIQPFSFNTWRIIEMIVNNQAAIDDLDPKLLP